MTNKPTTDDRTPQEALEASREQKPEPRLISPYQMQHGDHKATRCYFNGDIYTEVLSVGEAPAGVDDDFMLVRCIAGNYVVRGEKECLEALDEDIAIADPQSDAVSKPLFDRVQEILDLTEYYMPGELGENSGKVAATIQEFRDYHTPQQPEPQPEAGGGVKRWDDLTAAQKERLVAISRGEQLDNLSQEYLDLVELKLVQWFINFEAENIDYLTPLGGQLIAEMYARLEAQVTRQQRELDTLRVLVGRAAVELETAHRETGFGYIANGSALAELLTELRKAAGRTGE